jgi:hypothetical protein
VRRCGCVGVEANAGGEEGGGGGKRRRKIKKRREGEPFDVRAQTVARWDVGRREENMESARDLNHA